MGTTQTSRYKVILQEEGKRDEATQVGTGRQDGSAESKTRVRPKLRLRDNNKVSKDTRKKGTGQRTTAVGTDRAPGGRDGCDGCLQANKKHSIYRSLTYRTYRTYRENPSVLTKTTCRHSCDWLVCVLQIIYGLACTDHLFLPVCTSGAL